MSRGYPSVRPQTEGMRPVELPAGPYGIPDVMVHGFQSGKAATVSRHPLEHTESNWVENQRQMDMAMLRNMQGLHAPLRLQMERNVTSRFQRLPCLNSSNLLEDTLTGRDDLIDFGDVLNNPNEAEVVGQPHVLMEKRLKLL
ncbi:proteasome maturation protein-like [Haliotis asinina]|uniref:proteasome maturation protein-like n=1 Tax=Haliotis asinina TaxID=109174 RepID=UPI00353231B8